VEAQKVGDRTWMLVSGSGQCQHEVHHPRACRAYAVYTRRGYVIVRIDDKTENDQQFNDAMKSVKASIDEFLRDGEKYVD
jgi:Fe-S-cluster containining protein